MKSALPKIVYCLLAIVVITAVGILLFRAKIFASDIINGDQQMIDLGQGFGSRNVRVSVNKNVGKIEIEKNLFSSCNTELTGFQNETKIRGTISLGNNEKAVEVVGDAGIHGENRQYFTIENNFCPKPISFVKNDTVSYNIYSDEPIFLLQDFNADGITDLAAEYRNYDLNPIVDGTRDIYLFDRKNQQFVFKRTESFQYQELD